jgi:hypothetical protein
MSQSSLRVEHVRVTTEKPFAEFTKAFEGQLGLFDQDVHKELEDGGDPAAVKAKLESLIAMAAA